MTCQIEGEVPVYGACPRKSGQLNGKWRRFLPEMAFGGSVTPALECEAGIRDGVGGKSGCQEFCQNACSIRMLQPAI